MNENPTPSSLLTQLRNHQDAGWERLKILYGKLILYWCTQKFVPVSDCEDIFQDVMMSVVRGFDHFEKTDSGHTFRGWLRSITRNRIADYYRGRSKAGVSVSLEEQEVEIPLTEEENQTEHSILTEQVMKLIEKRFTGREKLWELLQLSLQGQMTSEDCARELGMTPGAFRQTKSRLVKSIREEFGGLFE